jgi:hypothetical protein
MPRSAIAVVLFWAYFLDFICGFKSRGMDATEVCKSKKKKMKSSSSRPERAAKTREVLVLRVE